MIGVPSASRKQVTSISLFIAGGLLLFFLSKTLVNSGELNSTSSDLEVLPRSLVTFPSKCSNDTVLDVKRWLYDTFFDGSSPFDGFPSAAVANHLDQKNRRKGWGSKSPVFERLMKEVKPQVVVEIGSFLGASAIHMAQIASDLGLETLILCVDDFRGWPGFRGKFTFIDQLNGDVMLLQNFMSNVVQSGFSETIIPVPFSTSHTLQFFCNQGIRADLIEVDAGHDFHSAWTDINLAFTVLRPGGVMFGHDYNNKKDKFGVRRAVDFFAQRHDLQVEPDGAHWILRPADFKIREHLSSGDSSENSPEE